MSMELIASTSSVTPAFSTTGTAARRLDTAVRSATSRGTPAGGIPARALSSRVPNRAAAFAASRTVARNSSSRPGTLSNPRSPFDQSPGAGSNSTRSRPNSSSAPTTRTGSSSCTKRISTRRNPASAAARNRWYTSRSGQSIVRLAANRGIASTLLRPAHRHARGLLPELHQRRHVLFRESPRERLEEPLLGERPEQQRDLRALRLGVDDPEILQEQPHRRRRAEVARDEPRQV